MSKLLKAKQTSLNQEAYSIQIEKLHPIQVQDPLLTESSVKAMMIADSIRSEAQADANRILNVAKQEADSMLEREQQRVQAILQTERDEAVQRGYEDGLSRGHQEVEAKFQSAFAEIEQLYQTAVLEREKYLQESESVIVDLACAVAQKIIQQELSVDHSFVLNVVRNALEEIQDAGKIEVRVHPDDFEWVNQNRTGLRKEVPGQTEVLVIPDRGVAAGGCVLQTPFGNVDARIDTQLEEVRLALQEVTASLKA